MENLFVKIGAVLVTFFTVGVNNTPAIPSVPPATPLPTQEAQISGVFNLPDLTGATPEKIASYTKEGNPAPISKDFNTNIGWQLESSVSLKQAINNSLASAKDVKKLCKTSTESFCQPNPLAILDKDYGFAVQYQNKFLIVWYSRFSNVEGFDQAKTFIATYDSLENVNALATTVYSSTFKILPTGQYSDLQLLNLTIFYYYPDLGRECISSTCGNSSALVKNGQVMAIDGKVVVAMGRYGGGSSCIVIQSQAILLCNSYESGSNRLTKQEAFWLK